MATTQLPFYGKPIDTPVGHKWMGFDASEPMYTQEGAKIAWSRWPSVPGKGEPEPCQAGTLGCCIDHEPGTHFGCDTW